MTSETILCPYCREFYELLYADEECVGQTNCKCVNKTKKLDEALQKLGEILNEESKHVID